MTPSYERAAWVCTHADEIVGHVALHDDALDPALDPASRATGLTPDQIVVVARLLVSPTARRRGVGNALMTQATKTAHGSGLRPVLDVAQHYEGAIALYEACGWTRAEQLTLTFPDGSVVESWLYLGPLPNA
jgi:GNAT superfamily N-acetyltransferase